MNENYRKFITPHNDMRELVGEIVKQFQYLESDIKELLKLAFEKGILENRKDFNFGKATAGKNIDYLCNKTQLFNNTVGEKLKRLIKFRNYIFHEHYLKQGRYAARQVGTGIRALIKGGLYDASKIIEYEEKNFPYILNLIFEATDCIRNRIYELNGDPIKIPNDFDS